jgi:hypothetical protein
MYLEEPDGALDELKLALEGQHFNLMYVAADPMFDSLRTDARFQRMITELRLAHTLSAHAVR